MCTHRNATLAAAVALLCALCPMSRAGGVDLKFELQAGLNLSRAIYDPASTADIGEAEHEFRPVFGGGGIVSMTFTDLDLLSLESGLLFQMKGGETRIPGTFRTIYIPEIEGTWVITWKLLYLTIPIHTRVALSRSRFVPYVKMGLDFDILLSAKFAETIESPIEYPKSERDIDNSSALDIGLAGGAGMEFPAGRARVFVEATYCHGMRNVLEPNPGIDVKLHNRVIGIMTGVRF